MNLIFLLVDLLHNRLLKKKNYKTIGKKKFMTKKNLNQFFLKDKYIYKNIYYLFGLKKVLKIKK